MKEVQALKLAAFGHYMGFREQRTMEVTPNVPEV